MLSMPLDPFQAREKTWEDGCCPSRWVYIVSFQDVSSSSKTLYKIECRFDNRRSVLVLESSWHGGERLLPNRLRLAGRSFPGLSELQLLE